MSSIDKVLIHMNVIPLELEGIVKGFRCLKYAWMEEVKNRIGLM